MLPPHQQSSFALNNGDSAVVDVGSTIGWGNFEFSTQLMLTPDFDAPQDNPLGARPKVPSFAAGGNVSANESVLDIDTSLHGIPYNHLSRARGMPLLSPGVKPIVVGESSSPSLASELNPLKAQVNIVPPNEQHLRLSPEGSTSKMKVDPGSPPPKIVLPSVAPRGDPLKSQIPSPFHDLSPVSSIPMHQMQQHHQQQQQQLQQQQQQQQVTSPASHLFTPSSSATSISALDRLYSASPALQRLQQKHALELEALLAKQQLDLATLVTAQRLECDAVLRGAPLIPVSNGVNLGILGVFAKLQALASVPTTTTMMTTHMGRSGLTNSEEIDILSVDEPSSDAGASSWKNAMVVIPSPAHAGYPIQHLQQQQQPSSSSSSSQVRGSSSRKSTKKKDSSNPSASSSPGGGSTPTISLPHAHHHHIHTHNSHYQKNAESSSEDDSRRTHRKRQRKLEPDYFVDDREMDQILGGGGAKKKRAELQHQQQQQQGQSSPGNAPTSSADFFPVPIPVTVPSSSSPATSTTPVPYKKPKPRDNVAIATILEIYSPLKTLLPPWKHTCGAKTLILYHTDCLDHITPDWHLESPNRLRAVMESIEFVSSRYGQFCEVVSDFKPAGLDLVRQCHEETYIKKIMNKIPLNRAMPPLHATQDIELSLSMSTSLSKPAADPACEPPKDTFVSFGSWNAALLAAGSVIEAIDRLMTQAVPATPSAMDPSSPENHTLRNVFCGVRPPGHHAGSHGHDGASTNGYCVLNSVAIGAQHAFNKYHFSRIAIIDFDVHQGNGTAQIVEKDPRILFISLHASEIYPFTESTKAEADKCTNRVINIGYPTGTNGKQFMEIFLTRCKQVIVDFDPELILLSSGFDAHVDDPTGAAQLRFADYVALTRTVKELADTPACKGRIVSVLEGGYDIRALKLSVTAHLLTLMEGQSSPITKEDFYGDGTYTPPPPKSLPALPAPASAAPTSSASSSAVASASSSLPLRHISSSSPSSTPFGGSETLPTPNTSDSSTSNQLQAEILSSSSNDVSSSSQTTPITTNTNSTMITNPVATDTQISSMSGTGFPSSATTTPLTSTSSGSEASVSDSMIVDTPTPTGSSHILQNGSI